MSSKKKATSCTPAARAKYAKSLASAETISSAATVRHCRNRPRRSKSTEARRSTYKEEFVGHDSAQVAMSVPRTIYNRTKDFDRMVAAISGDERAQAALMRGSRRMRSTEHQASFNAFTVQQMRDAIGVSPDLEERKKRVAEIYKRVRERAEIKAKEKRKEREAKKPEDASTLSMQMAMQRNQAIANDLVKGFVDLRGGTSSAETVSQPAARNGQKNRQRTEHKVMPRGIPVAAAQRAAKRSEPRRARLEAMLQSATGPKMKMNSTTVVPDPSFGKTEAMHEVPSIVPHLVSYLVEQKKGVHPGALSEANTTAPPFSSAASAWSELSPRVTNAARPQTSGINRAWEERSNSSENFYANVTTLSRPSSAPSIKRPLSAAGKRQEERTTWLSDAEHPSKPSRTSVSERSQSHTISNSGNKQISENSQAKFTVSQMAPFATPFPNQFGDAPVQMERPASAPALGRAVAPKAPFSAPFTPLYEPRQTTSDITYEKPQGSVLKLMRALSALSLDKGHSAINADERSTLGKRPRSALNRSCSQKKTISRTP